MKKRMKVPTDRSKTSKIRQKMRENARADKAKSANPLYIAARKAGLDPSAPHLPVLVGVDLASGPDVTTFGDYPRPPATSSIKCGECRHAETCGALKVCRSFLSPRAGFMHVAKHACGYGRPVEVAA